MSMRSHSENFTGAEGNRLAASVWGEGARNVLLLHGGGQTRHAWDKTGRALAEAGWRALALDQRGHGQSEWVESGHYAFPDYAADAAAVGRALKSSGSGPTVIVGASLGGIAGLYTFATDIPVLDGLVLVDIVPQMDPNGVAHVQGFMRAKAREGFASVEEAADAVAAYLPHRPRPRSLDGLRKNLRHDPDGRWRWHWDPRFLDGPRSVNSDWPDVALVLERAARGMSAPLMLVRGGGSELVTPAAAAAFCALAPHCDYADIAGARHMVAGDKNDAFSAAILNFLALRFPAQC
jgi:pimeloyl-ACP methyl ester carboxylesterase